MDKAPEDKVDLPPHLSYLKGLVTALAVVMIVGFLVLIGTLVTRLNAPAASVVIVPESLSLPEGAHAVAYTQGSDWVAVVTEADEILIFDAATGALRQTVTLN